MELTLCLSVRDGLDSVPTSVDPGRFVHLARRVEGEKCIFVRLAASTFGFFSRLWPSCLATISRSTQTAPPCRRQARTRALW